MGAPHLSLGPDALHTAQPDAAGWGLERAGRGRAEERESSTVIQMLLTRGTGGCTHPSTHVPRCQGARLRLQWHSQCSDWQLYLSGLQVLCNLPFLLPPSQGLAQGLILSSLVIKALTVGRRGPYSGLPLACPPNSLGEKAKSQGHVPKGSMQPLLLDHKCNALDSGIFSHPKPACFQGFAQTSAPGSEGQMRSHCVSL